MPRRGRPGARRARAASHPRSPPRLGQQSPEEEHGLGAFAEDPGERDDAHHPELLTDLGRVDPPLEITANSLGVSSHPPAVPRQHAARGEQHDRTDEIGPEIDQGPGEYRHRDPQQNARGDPEERAHGHVPEFAARSELLEVGVDEPEDQRRLEPLAQRDDEGAAHEPAYSATIRPLAVASWYSPKNLGFLT
jgi:hypothetical protein